MHRKQWSGWQIPVFPISIRMFGQMLGREALAEFAADAIKSIDACSLASH